VLQSPTGHLHFEAPIVIRVNILIEVAIMLGIAATSDMRTNTGLQIYQNDSWQDVPAIPDTFIINLGGLLLQHLSAGLLHLLPVLTQNCKTFSATRLHHCAGDMLERWTNGRSADQVPFVCEELVRPT
jgi:hypothetical protein